MRLLTENEKNDMVTLILANKNTEYERYLKTILDLDSGAKPQEIALKFNISISDINSYISYYSKYGIVYVKPEFDTIKNSKNIFKSIKNKIKSSPFKFVVSTIICAVIGFYINDLLNKISVPTVSLTEVREDTNLIYPNDFNEFSQNPPIERIIYDDEDIIRGIAVVERREDLTTTLAIDFIRQALVNKQDKIYDVGVYPIVGLRTSFFNETSNDIKAERIYINILNYFTYDDLLFVPPYVGGATGSLTYLAEVEPSIGRYEAKFVTDSEDDLSVYHASMEDQINYYKKLIEKNQTKYQKVDSESFEDFYIFVYFQEKGVYEFELEVEYTYKGKTYMIKSPELRYVIEDGDILERIAIDDINDYIGNYK